MAVCARVRTSKLAAAYLALLLLRAQLIYADQRFVLKLKPRTPKPGMLASFDIPDIIRNLNGTVQMLDSELGLIVVEVPKPLYISAGAHPDWDIIEPDHQYFIQQLDDAGTTPCARSICKGSECTPYGVVMTGATDPVFNKLTKGGGGGVTVCIVDSGINSKLRDFNGDLLSGCFDKNQCEFPWDEDELGHGTHVAGTIAAMRNNYGIVGILPGGARLYVVKAVAPDGRTNASQIVQALGACHSELKKWQVKDPRHKLIINLSLGGPNASETVHTKIKQIMKANDTLIISSVGNNELNRPKQVYYPAGWPEVISVSAVDCNRRRATFSLMNNQVDICAPGVNIVSTWPVPVDHVVGKLAINQGQMKAVDVLPLINSGYGAVTSGLVDCGLGSKPCRTTPKQRICLIERGGGVYFCAKVWNCMKGGGKAAIIFGNDTNIIRPKLSCNSTIARTCKVGITCPATIPSNYIPAVFLLNGVGAALKTRVKRSRTPIKAVLQNSLKRLDVDLQNGTSMACPHVSGVAAKLWAAYRECGSSVVRGALTLTAQDLGPKGKDDMYGHGLLQARAAAEYLSKQPCAKQGSARG